jgi:hypothetical protein
VKLASIAIILTRGIVKSKQNSRLILKFSIDNEEKRKNAFARR